MSAGGRLLLDRRDEALAAIECVPKWLRAEVRDLIEREHRAADTLARANAELRERIRSAIHRAADSYLTAPFRAVTDRTRWAGALWQYLERRYESFGLERRPCERVIRAALRKWTPPNGCSSRLWQAALDNHGGHDGRVK